MPFEKGKSGNLAGKPKGAKNKVTLELRERITKLLEGEFNAVRRNLKKLSPKDQVKAYCDLLQYSMPKLQATSLDFDFEKLTDEQLELFVQQIISKSNETPQGTDNRGAE